MNIKFFHGLGDVSNFCRLLPVYKKYGIDIGVKVTPDKEFVVLAAGGKLGTDENIQTHYWHNAGGEINTQPGSPNGWSGNKSGSNLHHFGLGDKATREQLWLDYKAVDIQCEPLIDQEYRDRVAEKIKNWPRPLVLWHSIGNTNKDSKSFHPNDESAFLYEFVNKIDGTVLILDWDNRAHWTHHHRIKHSKIELGAINLPGLAALMYQSNLMVGIDSGPYYFSAYTNIPSVGVFFNMHPAEFTIPLQRSLCINTVVRPKVDAAKRFEFQIIEQDRSMERVIEWCRRMLLPNRYTLPNVPIASDVQLQHIVQYKCRGKGTSTNISEIMDRDRSFDILLMECKKRFFRPKFVETGCIRSDEDWGGAGFSTALFGRYCQLTGGRLISFDLDQKNVNYATSWCRQFGEHTKIICCRGNEGIKAHQGKIDVLYLDSLDSGIEGHQECNLEEFKIAEEKLHDKSIVIIDDTPTNNIGKGVMTVKYMLDKGWKFLYQGYQVVLSRT